MTPGYVGTSHAPILAPQAGARLAGLHLEDACADVGVYRTWLGSYACRNAAMRFSTGG